MLDPHFTLRKTLYKVGHLREKRPVKKEDRIWYYISFEVCAVRYPYCSCAAGSCFAQLLVVWRTRRGSNQPLSYEYNESRLTYYFFLITIYFFFIYNWIWHNHCTHITIFTKNMSATALEYQNILNMITRVSFRNIRLVESYSFLLFFMLFEFAHSLRITRTNTIGWISFWL